MQSLNKLKQHPLSAAFPAMDPEHFQALKDSIENIGVQEPITVLDGMVIDGWHRYTAAQAVGMPCPMVDLADVDPQDFVIAKNKVRRHITQAQLAMAVTAVYAWSPVGSNQHGGCAVTAHPPKTRSQMATAAGVGTRTIAQAKMVHTKAAPEVQDAVKRGQIGLEKASKIAALPKSEQAAAIAKPMPKKEIEDEQYFGPSDDEIAAAQLESANDLTSLMKLVEADDKLAAAVAEIKRLQAELAAVKSVRDGHMNRCNELINRITSLKRQLKKAEAANV